MGNDSSRLTGLIIDKNAVETNDFWALYNAEMPSYDNGKQLLSIFQGEPVVAGQLWVAQLPMERAIKNLMIYRHPYILKYVATWEQAGQKHLATERVRPLIAEFANLSDIQVCLGLRTILCSLIFLIEKAQARHLNICMSSINVALDGSWRLAGFQYVWKSKEVTKTLLDLANAHRYKAAIDPREMKENNSDTIEQYAFATLCEEIFAKLGKRTNIMTPYVQEFRTYCASHLKHKTSQMRPSLSAVLKHPYFNHEFVLIHSFLIELPLKNATQKQEFFTSLIDRLRCFNEQIVGAQLAELLLSRMVLLDPTAQLCVTPYVLKTKNDHSSALFSYSTYNKYLIPHIKKKFRLRDAQIRLILLEYFMEIVRLLPKEELQDFVLPHLKMGLRDTNDILVAKTMHCLADLVPLLGSTLVLGGERVRLFSDGRPQAALPNTMSHWVEPRSITPVMGVSNSIDYMVSGSPLPLDNAELGSSLNSLLPQTDALIAEQIEMPPRLSPDGGEDDKISSIVTDGILQTSQQAELPLICTTSHEDGDTSASTANLQEESKIKSALEQTTDMHHISYSMSQNGGGEEEDDAWSDWETDELQRINSSNQEQDLRYTLPPRLDLMPPEPTDALKITEAASPLKTNASIKINDDLNALDIIVHKSGMNQNEAYDFFKDMEPVIDTRHHNLITDMHPATASPASEKLPQLMDEEIKIDSSRFAAAVSNESGTSLAESNGWAVDDDDDDEVGWGGTATV